MQAFYTQPSLERSIMDEKTLDLLNQLKDEAESLTEEDNHIFTTNEAITFLEIYIMALIDFYNKRYPEYTSIEFNNIRPYLPFIRINKGFTLVIQPLSMKELTSIIQKRDENLATLIENTDISNRLSFPIDISDEKSFKFADYLEKPLLNSLKVENIRSLTSFSKTLFVIPNNLEFITSFFKKKQTILKNYFEVVNINPFNNQPLQIVGEIKELYRNGQVMTVEQATSIEKLALFHNETKKRSIDFLVQEYKHFYEFITNPDNYLLVRETLYLYTMSKYPMLCI